MKTIFALFLSMSLLFGASSCVIFVTPKHDNGKHKGWYKHPRHPNPSHPAEQKGNNGNGNGKKKGK